MTTKISPQNLAIRRRVKSGGAFGGPYRHELIQNLRHKLVSNQLVVMALIKKYNLDKNHVEQIVREFMQDNHNVDVGVDKSNLDTPEVLGSQ